MNENRIRKLIEKYQRGETSLQEEQLLFDQKDGLDSGFNAWSNYLENNKIKPPADFNNNAWQKFQATHSVQRNGFVGLSVAAASIVFMLSFLISNHWSGKQSEMEKKLLLSQALNLVAESEENMEEVLYENDMIVIYTTSKPINE